MNADTGTISVERAIRETERRRSIQTAYNTEHHIVPQTIHKSVRDILEISAKDHDKKKSGRRLSPAEKKMQIAKWTAEMKNAAKLLEFEHAAYLRDKIKKLQNEK